MTRASDTARLIGAGATINDGTTITTADNTTQLTLKSTDADGSSGPLLDLTRDSGSPADGDVTGIIRFRADNDAGEVTTTGQIVSLLNDASDGTEDGEMKLEVMSGGAAQSRIDIIPSETVFNEGSIDVDFRVESNGNANMLVVDAGNDRVGIGTNSPSAPLTISTTGSGDAVIIESTESGSSNAPDLVLHRNSASPADNDSLGIIRFRGENDASEAIDLINIFGQVTDVSDGSEDSTLFFKTYTNGAEQSPLTLVGANVGIGTTSPATDLSVSSSGASAKIFVGRQVTSGNLSNTAAGGTIEFGAVNSSTFAEHSGASIGLVADQTYTAGSAHGSALKFSTASDDSTTLTERMRIDSSGNVGIGMTPSSSVKLDVEVSSTNHPARFSSDHEFYGTLFDNSASSGNRFFCDFRINNSSKGSITSNGTTTSFNESSDYRLKENVITDWDATSRLKQLKPSRFNFKIDKDTTVDGFLAHEVSEIVPEAVTGEKDAMTKEVLYVDGDRIPEGKKVGDVKEVSKIDPQGIDKSKLVPLLTKALQEAISEIDTLKEKVTALESK